MVMSKGLELTASVVLHPPSKQRQILLTKPHPFNVNLWKTMNTITEPVLLS